MWSLTYALILIVLISLYMNVCMARFNSNCMNFEAIFYRESVFLPWNLSNKTDSDLKLFSIANCHFYRFRFHAFQRLEYLSGYDLHALYISKQIRIWVTSVHQYCQDTNKKISVLTHCTHHKIVFWLNSVEPSKHFHAHYTSSHIYQCCQYTKINVIWSWFHQFLKPFMCWLSLCRSHIFRVVFDSNVDQVTGCPDWNFSGFSLNSPVKCCFWIIIYTIFFLVKFSQCRNKLRTDFVDINHILSHVPICHTE
jgi:hypothetical protein